MMYLRFSLSLIVISVALVLVAVPANTYGQDDTAAAIELFNSGQDAHEKGDLKKALELYRDAILKFSEFPEAHYQMATALIALGRPSEAETALRKAIELRDDWTLPMTTLGSLLVQSGKFDEAESLLDRALEIDGQNAAAVAGIAELRLRTGADPKQLSEILGRVRELTGKANPVVSLWIVRSALERTLGDPSAARTSIGRALAADPSNKTALAERAEVLLAANDIEGALADAESLVRSNAESAPFRFLLSRALAAAGRKADALKNLDMIASKSNEMIDFRERLTTASSENIAELEKRAEEDPKNIAVFARLCGLFRTSDPVKSLGYCRRASELDPGNIDHVIGYGAALVQAKQYVAAVELLGRIVAAQPDNYTARANLAVALFQLKRWPEAKTHYIWITEQRPEVAGAYYFLAIVHDQLKEYMDAMANYQAFLKIADPDQFRIEIEKVNLRLPSLQKQIRRK